MTQNGVLPAPKSSTIYPLNHDNGLVVFPQTRHSFSSYSFKFKVYLTMHLTLSKVTPVTPYNSHLSFYLLFLGKFLPSYPFYPLFHGNFLPSYPLFHGKIFSPSYPIVSPLPWQFLAILSHFIPSFIANYCHLIPFSMANSCLLIPLYPLFHGKSLPSYPRYMTVSLTLPLLTWPSSHHHFHHLNYNYTTIKTVRHDSPFLSHWQPLFCWTSWTQSPH